MGYIGSGETKVIDKQGYIYVDVCNFTTTMEVSEEHGEDVSEARI